MPTSSAYRLDPPGMSGLHNHLQRATPAAHSSSYVTTTIYPDTPPLAKDAQRAPTQGPDAGKIIAIPQVGACNHRYQRIAA